MRSSLQVRSCTAILREEHAKLATLWQSLQDHNDSFFFRSPVDLRAFPDYLDYVREPMDLSTVQRRLREGRYRSVEEMLDEIQLIWDNCRQYNPAGTWIFNISISMDRAFRKMARYYFPQIVLDRPARPMRVEAAEEDDIFPREEVSFQQKYALVEQMQLLPPCALQALAGFIAELAPKAFEEEGGSARILLDNIDALSFPLVREKLEELRIMNKAGTKKVKSI